MQIPGWIITILVLGFLIYTLVNGPMSLIENVAISLIGGLAASLSLVYWLYFANSNIKFRNSFYRLKGEMDNNINKLCNFQQDLEKFKKELLQKDIPEAWLPKHAVITPWSRFVFHYLSLNAFLYFIDQEFISDSRLQNDQIEHLMVFYANCIRFNNDSQSIEDEINQERRKKIDSGEGLEDFVIKKCNEIDQKYQKYHMEIICHYESFKKVKMGWFYR